MGKMKALDIERMMRQQLLEQGKPKVVIEMLERDVARRDQEIIWLKAKLYDLDEAMTELVTKLVATGNAELIAAVAEYQLKKQ